MCKGKFKRTCFKGYRLEDVYEKLGDTKDICSILPVETVERKLISRIMGKGKEKLADDEDVIDPIVDDWNQKIIVQGKKIWWQDLLALDVMSRQNVAPAPPGAPARAAPRGSPAAEATPHTRNNPPPPPPPSYSEETESLWPRLVEKFRHIIQETLAGVSLRIDLLDARMKSVEDFMKEQRKERRNEREGEYFVNVEYGEPTMYEAPSQGGVEEDGEEDRGEEDTSEQEGERGREENDSSEQGESGGEDKEGEKEGQEEEKKDGEEEEKEGNEEEKEGEEEEGGEEDELEPVVPKPPVAPRRSKRMSKMSSNKRKRRPSKFQRSPFM